MGLLRLVRNTCLLALIAGLVGGANTLFSAETAQSKVNPESGLANATVSLAQKYLDAKGRFMSETNDEALWHFGRACFDLADGSTNQTRRAEIAEEGITACRQLVARSPNSAAGHYYLGMNLGQLADTKRNLSALKIVGEMEREFTAARKLDQSFDYAGPDRNLGLLYLQAPRLISIGNSRKAREHLMRAVELAPLFPENRLNLIEAFLKWDDDKAASQDLDALEKILPDVKKKFSGDEWAASWTDWNKRINDAADKLDEPTKRLKSPHSQR